MFSSFNALYRFALNVVVFLTAILIIFVFWGLSALLISSFNGQIPFIIFGIIAGVLVGSYLHILLLIPLHMAQQFDTIKNKTSQRFYKTVNEFQKDVALFLIGFFRFPGLNIVGGLFQFNNAEPLIEGEIVDREACEKILELGKMKTLDKNHKGWYLPIVLSDKKLGYMVLVTEGFTLPFFKNILQDFENYMLDDQLLHVINYTH